jgi:hypothetical protein
MDREDGVAGIVLTVEHERQLYGVKLVQEAGGVTGYFGEGRLIALFHGKLKQLIEIVGTLGQRAPLFCLILQVCEAAHGALGGAAVVPEAGLLGLL